MDLINEDDDTSLLAIVLDMNIYSWGNRARTLNEENESNSGKYIALSSFLDHLLLFINAYLMLNQENQVAVISSRVGESSFIYPHPSIDSTSNESIPEKIIDSLHNISQSYIDDFNLNVDRDCTTSSFSAAMSLALCYINRVKKDIPNIRPRILVFNISPDVSNQYIPVMNCIFSAQKQSIPVDSCILSSTDSTFLQQASHITNGVYLKPQKQENLSQYLLSSFLIDSFSRKYLSIPILKTVDYSASCFCHKKSINIGFVCSVCLSIFCKYTTSCTTCGTKFALKIELPKSVSKASSSTTTTNNNNNDQNKK